MRLAGGVALLAAFAGWVMCGPLWALDRSTGAAGVDADLLIQPPLSLSGLGVTVGILDGQIDEGHPALLVAGNGGNGPPQARATQVAGVIASGDPVYTGLAPAVFLYGYGLTDQSQVFEGANWLTRPEQGAEIVVYSRTWPLGGNLLDGSSPETLHVDHLAAQRDVLFVVAGNQQPGGTPLPTDAYNALTVNALVLTALPGYERYDQVALWNNYGQAPTDGRAKPDLLAPGGYEGPGEHDPESIRTTTLGGGWADVSNTAMAAAHVAGVAALLKQFGRQASLSTDHNVLKAVLINSAEKMIWDTNWQDWFQSEAINDPSVPLDDQMGAGAVLASSAYYQYSAGQWGPGIVPSWGFDHNTLTHSATRRTYHFGIPLAAGLPLSVTLTWDRRVSLEDDQDGDGEYDFGQTDRLVAHGLNNLDIELRDQRGTVIGGSWSAVDNVEHLYWVVPEDGIYYLSVELSEVRDLPEQTYALAWTAFPADAGILYWLSGEGEWGSANWDDGTGLSSPAGGEQAAVFSGRVTVASAYVGSAGPTSLLLYGGEVEVSVAGELEAADAVSVADESVLLVNGTLVTGELFVQGDELPGGAQGGTLAGNGVVEARQVYLFGTLSPGDPGGLGGLSTLGGGGVLESSPAPGAAPGPGHALALSDIFPSGAGGAAVPEPSSALLLAAAGLCAAAGLLLRRRSS